MSTLFALYLQNPFWIWMAFGALFVALDLAAGTGKLVWPAIAAALIALINLTGARIAPAGEIGLFIVLSVAGLALSFSLGRHRGVKPARASIPPSPAGEPLPLATGEPEILQPASASQTTLRPTAPQAFDPASRDRTARLIGRIGRTTSEFINGVGRVWIDGAEWSAEIEAGDYGLPADAPVRVLGVAGGIRLKVQALTAA
jgi:membrane protein implicated in regulation of membrane protease activity